MKIVYAYHNIANVGGAGKIIIDKMNLLAENYDYEIYLITYSQGKHDFCYPLSNKVKHIDIGVPFHLQYKYKYLKKLWLKWYYSTLFKRKIKKQIDIIDPDILIGLANDAGCPVCKIKSRAKKITESHVAKFKKNHRETSTDNLFKMIFLFINAKWRQHIIEKYSDVVVCLTKGDVKEWEKANKVAIIPNTIHHGPVTTNHNKTNRVLSIGRLTPLKGFDRLINAWKIINNRHPEWELLIIGEGECKSALQKQIVQNKLEGAIKIHPFTSQITEEYLKSSIFVLASRYEGFGLVLAEAMACGVPCISFDCPYGPSDIIKNKEDGLVIENGNIKQLADSICYLIENKHIREVYGEKARQNIARYYPENIMPQWDQLFKQLVNG